MTKKMRHILNKSYLSFNWMWPLLWNIWLTSGMTYRVPLTPCPFVFRYHSDGNAWFGLVRIETKTQNTVANLEIELVLPLTLPKGSELGTIETVGTKIEIFNNLYNGKPLLYKINFPLKYPLPYVSKVLFNDKIICEGPHPKPRYATLLKLEHTLNFTEADNSIGDDTVKTDVPGIMNRHNFNDHNLSSLDRRYGDDVEIHYAEECGLSTIKSNPLIVGSYDTAKGDWPWLASLFINKITSLDFICAASLVSARLLLTAAHCVYESGIKLNSSSFLVNLGSYDLIDWTDEDMMSRTIARIETPPYLNPDRILRSDIAALVLHKSVSFTEFIRPVCLWDNSMQSVDIVGKLGSVVGWGKDGLGEVLSSFPKLIQVPIVSTDKCRASKEEFFALTSDKTICAGARDGSGPCNGDSGGGLYIQVRGRWMIRGIISSSLRDDDHSKSCNLKEYIVYTDVMKYADWIRSL